MADDDCDLDTLLDVLDEEEEDEEDTTFAQEGDGGDEASQEEENDEIQGAVDRQVEDEGGDEVQDDADDEELKQQLKEMEEKMRKMKEKLKNKSAEKKAATKPAAEGSQSSPAAASSGSAASPCSSQTTVTVNDGKSSKAASQKRVEADIFSCSGSNLGSNSKKLLSPVKTQPLKECEREKRAAKFEPRSTEWCPSLIRQDTTRVIQGSEAEKLRAELARKDLERMENIARRDLMDSSDEEDKDAEGNPLYSEAGKEMKKRIAHSAATATSASLQKSQGDGSVDRIKKSGVSSGFADKPGNTIPLGKAEKRSKEASSHFKITVEKNSGIRLWKPLFTPAQIQEAMGGRKMVHLSKIREANFRKECDGDWVTFGIVYYKAPPKQGSNGSDFSIWKLTDLKGEIKTVTLFLFGSAHKTHWKVPINKVIGLLNPKILEDRENSKNKGESSISIHNGDMLMEVGDSADIAKCKFVKQDGTNCVNIVDKSTCEYCVYHVKKAYAASSGARHALQSSFSGPSSEATRKRIMQKIAPSSKGDVFAGGRIMNPAAPMEVGRKSAKEKARDAALLARLQESPGASVKKIMSAERPAGGPKQSTYGSRLSEAEKKAIEKISKTESEALGKKLLLPTTGAKAILATLVKEDKKKEEVKKPVVIKSAMDLLRDHSRAIQRGASPKLGRGGQGDNISIDLSPTVKSNYAASHARALALLKLKNKSIKADDPNAGHKSKNKNKTPESKEKVAKRLASALDDEQENDENVSNKKPRLDDKLKTVTVFGKEMSVEELNELRGKKSRNTHLAAEAELEQTDKYFQVMEKKDEMEEKMLGTLEVKTKAVTCHICNYTSFKASELCREAGHRYKVIEAVKRFFSCKNCKKRVTVLTKLPQESCGQCGGSNWVRAGMVAERKGPKMGGETLSVRGNEEKWIGSAKTTNLDL